MARTADPVPSHVPSPFGSIELTTRQDASPDFDLITFHTMGRLILPDGEVAGVCRFASYRKLRDGAALSAAGFCREMEAVSQEELDLGEALAAWNPPGLEGYLNDSCLLIAERVEVFAPLKGSGAWKSLYLATMEKALASHPKRPETFFFTVFPLDFTGRVSRANHGEYLAALRNMKLFYAAHLDARAFGVPGKNGCFMRAPVPASMLG